MPSQIPINFQNLNIVQNVNCIVTFDLSDADAILSLSLELSYFANSCLYVDYSFPCFLFEDNAIRKINTNVQQNLAFMLQQRNLDQSTLDCLGFDFTLADVLEKIYRDEILSEKMRRLETIISSVNNINNVISDNGLHQKWRCIYFALFMLMIKKINDDCRMLDRKNNICLTFSKNQTNPFSEFAVKFEPIVYIDFIENYADDFIQYLLMAKNIMECDNSQMFSKNMMFLDHDKNNYEIISDTNFELFYYNRDFDTILDISGSSAFFSNPWFKTMLNNSEIKLASIMGGVFANISPFTKGSIPKIMNGPSESCINQIYAVDYFMELAKIFKNRKTKVITTTNHAIFVDPNIITNIRNIFGEIGNYPNLYFLTEFYYGESNNFPAKKPFDYFNAMAMLWALNDMSRLDMANQKTFVVNLIGQAIVGKSPTEFYPESSNLTESGIIFNSLIQNSVQFKTAVIIPVIPNEMKLSSNTHLSMMNDYKLLLDGENYDKMYA